MAKIERNKKATNPSRRPMSVFDMTHHRIMKLNELALKKLDEIDKKRKLLFKNLGGKDSNE